jgi:hypothetical protein
MIAVQPNMPVRDIVLVTIARVSSTIKWSTRECTEDRLATATIPSKLEAVSSAATIVKNDTKRQK